MQEAWKRQLAGPRAPAESVRRFENEHVYAGRGKRESGGEAIWTATDDDCAGHAVAMGAATACVGTPWPTRS